MAMARRQGIHLRGVARERGFSRQINEGLMNYTPVTEEK